MALLATAAYDRRALADLHLRVDDGFFAPQLEGGRLARLQRGDQVKHHLRITHRFAGYGEQDVSRANAAVVRGAAAHNAGDQRTVGAGQAEGFGDLRRDLLGFDADPAARDASALDDLLHHAFRGRHGNREADAERAARARVDRGIDADQVAGRIGQRPAGIAGIDRRVGLDEILEGVDSQLCAPQRRDDAHRHALADAERVADRQHDVADANVFHASERDRGKARILPRRRADPEDREIGFGIGADRHRL